jgi:hypothetical protein
MGWSDGRGPSVILLAPIFYGALIFPIALFVSSNQRTFYSDSEPTTVLE